MNCKNCDQNFEGNFCNHCGQESKVGKLDFPNFLNDVTESVFQINKGFFFTLKELILRPGKSLNEYLNGKRKNHFKPIPYLLTLSTIYILISQVTNQNTWIDDAILGWKSGEIESGREIPEIASWFSKNYAYSTLLLLPVFSLASYLSFLKFGKNYLEHLLVNSYITGQQAIFYSLFAIGGTFVNSELFEIIPLMVSISYTLWVYWQFFSEENRIFNIFRTMMTYLLYLIFSAVLFFGVLGINGMNR